MASTFDLKLNRGAVRQVLTGAATVSLVNQVAHRIASAAGPGMEVLGAESSPRARAAVFTRTFPARYAEATRRALTAAVGAGRGSR